MNHFNTPQNSPESDLDPTLLWSRDGRRAPLRLSSPVKPESEGLTLYYPGSGTDYGPLIHWAERLLLKTVVYADYLSGTSEIKEMILKVCDICGVAKYPTFQPLHARLFGASNWSRFWPEDRKAQMFSNPSNGRGIQCSLNMPNGSLKFIFLRTEAHQTYANLLDTELQPDIVVLQEHGFGCNWQDFGGQSAMHSAAAITRNLPRWLFVAENTKPWPGYEQVETFAVQDGQMHTHGRALFELVKE